MPPSQTRRQPQRDIYKLTIVNNQSIIQGLISLEIKSDHVYMHLVESAPFNKGKLKVYSGVPGNLVAFACKLAFHRGHEGNVYPSFPRPISSNIILILWEQGM